jgi:hypothetical protein
MPSILPALCAFAAATSAAALDVESLPLGRRNLSPLLRAGADVFAPSKVGPLPGINSTSYSGFFEVNATDHASLFFWLWPALNGNASAPLLVWLQGGPGSSSLFGMLVELGPYRVTTADLQPAFNPYSWAQTHHVVFVDNPRGTGYSFTDPGTLCTTWECYGCDFDSFLRQLVSAYSLQDNDVYITGESYGGHYVPASAYTVHANNAAGALPRVNLRGIAVGNGFVAPYEMSQGYADAIYNAGLISGEDYVVAQSYVANITARIQADDFVGASTLYVSNPLPAPSHARTNSNHFAVRQRFGDVCPPSSGLPRLGRVPERRHDHRGRVVYERDGTVQLLQRCVGPRPGVQLF